MMRVILAGTLLAFAGGLLGGCAGQSAAVPVPSPTPIVITPASSCNIGGITISGPAVTGCGQ